MDSRYFIIHCMKLEHYFQRTENCLDVIDMLAKCIFILFIYINTNLFMTKLYVYWRGSTTFSKSVKTHNNNL